MLHNVIQKGLQKFYRCKTWQKPHSKSLLKSVTSYRRKPVIIFFMKVWSVMKMARLIKSTKEKIERLNKLVESNTDYKEILKQEWQGSPKAKDKWVNKFREHLTKEVLTVLEQRDKAVEEKLQEQQKPTESTTESTTNDILIFLQDKDNFKALQEIIARHLNNESIEELVVPSEYLTASTSIKTIRVNAKVYDSFTMLCKRNNLTIGSCITYALALFVEKFS